MYTREACSDRWQVYQQHTIETLSRHKAERARRSISVARLVNCGELMLSWVLLMEKQEKQGKPDKRSAQGQSPARSGRPGP
jgi:hypothetical protein